MPEIADVVTLTTISSDWGNDIRDRTIQRYASVAARTAAHPSPTEGDLSYLNDANEVFVYNGSAWVAQGSVWAPSAGGAQHGTVGTLTTTPVAKASVVFTKPATWATYALVAWGAAAGGSSGAQRIFVELAIGASVGVSNAGLNTTPYGLVPCFHSVTAQTTSPVTVAVQVSESGADATYYSSTVQYIATRLT